MASLLIEITPMMQIRIGITQAKTGRLMKNSGISAPHGAPPGLLLPEAVPEGAGAVRLDAGAGAATVVALT